MLACYGGATDYKTLLPMKTVRYINTLSTETIQLTIASYEEKKKKRGFLNEDEAFRLKAYQHELASRN
jgi:hypothetical protein